MATPPPAGGPRRSPDLRASDADRERVAAILREAHAEGRIAFDELDERLSAVYAAKTYADLEPVTRDLPDHQGRPSRAGPGTAATAWAGRIGGEPSSHIAVGIMSGFTRAGSWVVPAEFTAVALMGGGELDLREARFAQREVRIWALALMGGITVTVPEDAEVHVTGIGIMGGFEQRASGAGAPGAPRIVVTGLALMGGVDVKRKPPKRRALAAPG
jgi:hypothetical protein